MKYFGSYSNPLNEKNINGKYVILFWNLLCIDVVMCSFHSLSDHEIVWKYVDWTLEKDQEKGVQVIIYWKHAVVYL